jgi:small multidrug resistance family-3 protein
VFELSVIVKSISYAFWGWKVDGIMPDRFDIIGGAIALAGHSIIMYWPRGG